MTSLDGMLGDLLGLSARWRLRFGSSGFFVFCKNKKSRLGTSETGLFVFTDEADEFGRCIASVTERVIF